ncbi:MAG: HRDC domain-containing protein, partial [Pirellulales bacterium]|nr:HRDC domain-containing protein [Pirellulales bacterium]
IERAMSHEPWRRVSGNSGLNPRSLAILRELWRWRDAEAKHHDKPPRRILRDDLMVEVARRKTADPKRIGAVRGMERGDLRRHLPKLAECVRRGMELPDSECPGAPPRERGHQLSVLGQFLFAALGSVCRQLDLAPGLVGTPNDVRALIAYRNREPGVDMREPPLLARGWRAEVVGHLFDDLLSGKTSVRIDDPLSDHPLAFE